MPSPTSAPAEVLRALAAVLDRLHAGWYVFGAQAVLLWGRPRFTADIDVTVRMNPEVPEVLVEDMERSGFSLRVPPAGAFVRTTRVLPFVHDGTGWPLDLVLAGPGLEEQFLARAVPVDVGGVTVPVISAEDLVATKILAGRPKDIEDVRGVLLERAGRLDLASVRRTLELLEEALAVSDLIPAFDAEVARVEPGPGRAG